jgi:hypothetical protein
VILPTFLEGSLLVADAAEEAGVPTILHAGTERVVVPPKNRQDQLARA